MLVLFGYMSETGLFSNAIFDYDININRWEILYSISSELEHPIGRMNSSATLVGDTIYAFGGTSKGLLLNDYWSFHIPTRKWNEIKP